MYFLIIGSNFRVLPSLILSRPFRLSLGVLLSEVGVVLSDDITSRSGSVELLRLTLSKLIFSLAPLPSPLPPEPADEGGVTVAPALALTLTPDASLIQVCCSGLQVDNQLYRRASFHFPVLLCQEQRGAAEPAGPWSSEANPAQSPEALEEFRSCCCLQLRVVLAADRRTVEEVSWLLLFFSSFLTLFIIPPLTLGRCGSDSGPVLPPQVTFQLQPARVYLEDTFVYYIKTLFHTYIPHGATAQPQTRQNRGSTPTLPDQVPACVPARRGRAFWCLSSASGTSDL